MGRMHGKSIRVYLGERDVSGDLLSVEASPTVETHDATTFAAGDWRRFDPGLAGWEGSLEAFYNPVAGGIGRQLETALGADTAGLGVLSIYDGDADAIGDTGILGSESILTKRGQAIGVADLVKLSGTLKGNGRLGANGTLLHPKGAETATGSGSGLDNGAASSSGGRANLHVTSITGTWTIKVQHSPDGSAWADLATFAGLTTAGGHTVEVSGTVDQHLRWDVTESVAGSCELVLGFARY